MGFPPNPTARRRTTAAKRSRDRPPAPPTGRVAVLLGTRKGAFILRGDRTRRAWKLSEPNFLGHTAHHGVLDPRDCRTLLIAARTGHLGPTVFRSADFGKTWKRLDAGLPQRAWFTVKRQAMAADAHEPVGRYFGTTSGELWASRSEGEKWTCLARHLPEIYSVEAAELPR